MNDFGSLITAMITPFKESDPNSVDYDALEKLVEHLAQTGTDSIVVSGTTGESPTLTHEEEAEIFKFTKEKANSINPNIKIIFGTGSNSTQTVIESNQKAEALGADGALIVVPYYNKPNQKGLKAHFDAIAKNTSLPIILYNIPGRSVINMSAELIIELAQENPNIVGLKEASNNIDQISKIRQSLDSNQFKIYSGDDSLTLAMMSVGANGVISVASHLVGNEMKEMISASTAGDTKKSEQIHHRLFSLFEALFVEPNPICVKAALNIQKICSAKVRKPLVELEESQEAELQKIIDKTLAILK